MKNLIEFLGVLVGVSRLVVITTVAFDMVLGVQQGRWETVVWYLVVLLAVSDVGR